MYQRKLAPAEEVVRRQFGASVQETQLRLEKDLLARMSETRPPGSRRACHLRFEAPWHLRQGVPPAAGRATCGRACHLRLEAPWHVRTARP